MLNAFPLGLVVAQAPVQPSHGQWELPTSTLFDGASCSNDSSTLNASVSPTSTSISAKLVVTKPFNMFARNMATTKLSRSARMVRGNHDRHLEMLRADSGFPVVQYTRDRKSVGEGTSVNGGDALGGRLANKKHNTTRYHLS